MRRQSHSSLRIICAVLSQVITVSSDENIDESSDLHIRKKRVIDKTSSGQVPGSLRRAPYIVNILKDSLSHCSGVILDSDIILTVNTCIEPPRPARFSILSGSSMRNRGFLHNITSRISVSASNLAMFKISPPIDLHQGPNAKVELFRGVLPANAYAWFSGWGCISIEPGIPPIFPQKLMMTRLPLISLQECEQTYKGPIRINISHICTLDKSKRRATCIGDEGGPLVYKNQLIGVLLYRTLEIGIHPDVFVNLNHPYAQNWVNEMIVSLQR